MDVKGAYSKAPTDKEIYVPQPLGYVKIDENGTELTGQLRKSLYGLKQSVKKIIFRVVTYLVQMA